MEQIYEGPFSAKGICRVGDGSILNKDIGEERYTLLDSIGRLGQEEAIVALKSKLYHFCRELGITRHLPSDIPEMGRLNEQLIRSLGEAKKGPYPKLIRIAPEGHLNISKNWRTSEDACDYLRTFEQHKEKSITTFNAGCFDLVLKYHALNQAEKNESLRVHVEYVRSMLAMMDDVLDAEENSKALEACRKKHKAGRAKREAGANNRARVFVAYEKVASDPKIISKRKRIKAIAAETGLCEKTCKDHLKALGK